MATFFLIQSEFHQDQILRSLQSTTPHVYKNACITLIELKAKIYRDLH